MAVLVYSRRSRRGTELSRLLEVTSGHVIERITGVQELSERIQGLNVDLEAAVLLLSSRRELDWILSLQEMLFNIPVLLILPDKDEDTVSKGHSLRPRYLCFPDTDFTEIAAVLGGVLDRAERLRSKWSNPNYKRKGECGRPSSWIDDDERRPSCGENKG